ncbi:MAG: flagellar biosynthesis protein FlhF [Planctomycetes bacterium]|nr:flagellar biosynthesis protein FlhF [Planctomycetota bacterium]
MIIKKLTGDSFEELLRQAKKELGDDFVIIKTEAPRPRKGLMKLFGRQKYVLVATDAKMSSRQSETPAKTVEKHVEKNYEPLQTPRAAHCDTTQAQNNCPATLQALNEVRDMLADIYAKTRMKSAPEELFNAYLALINNCVSEKLAQNIISKLQKKLVPEQLTRKDAVNQALKLAIRNLLKNVSPIQLKNGKTGVIAFIGPTGVGKTTTIAKIASNITIYQKKKVGVITADATRIGAADQLQKIVEIIKLPFARVDSEDPKAIQEAVRKMSGNDVILIDTAGRSPLDKEKMAELRKTLAVIKPDETHLVLSITTNMQTIDAQLEKFSDFKYDKLILTKLDETTKFGLILDVLSKVKISLSYITTGQVIPCDIEMLPDAEKLTKLIVGEQSCARPS